MNTLKLKLNPYNDINIASLDGKPLSPYSEMSNFLKEPFLKWAGDLLEAAEREINDDFQIIVMAEEFETKMLHDMQNDFDACQDIKKDDFQLSYSVNERYEFVVQLLKKYDVDYSYNEYLMPIYTEMRLPLDERMVRSTNIENAFLIVTDRKDIIDKVKGKNGPAIVVIVSNRSVASKIGDMKYLWEIEEARLKEILGCIIDRFVKIPYVVGAVHILKERIDEFEKADAEKLSMATEIDTFIIVEDIEEIEVGRCYSLKMKTVPEGGNIPNLRVTTSNPSIVKVDGLNLTAVAPGKAYVEVYRAEEIIPFAKKNVVTFRNNFIQEICLDLNDSQMGIGRTQKLGIKFVPEDAEDIHLVEWKSSNNEVIKVDREGNVTAIAAGKTMITAFTSRTSQSINIEVLPNISSIKTTVTNSDLYVGQTQPINVSIEPKDCFDNSYEWKSSDKEVAIIDKLDDGTTVIRATGIGSCTLTCIAKEGGCSTSCFVNVESTFKKRENMHGMLSATMACLIVSIFCAAFRFTFGAVAAAVVTIICGVMTIGKNKADRFWAFSFIAIAALIALISLDVSGIF